jgi:hypothetical protein
MSKRRSNTNMIMNRIPVYCNINTSRLHKLRLGKKIRRMVSYTTLNYRGVKTISQKSRSSKGKLIEYKKHYYTSFIKKKETLLESLSSNQFHLVALNGTSVSYSFVNVVAVKKLQNRLFMISEKCPNVLETSYFFAFKISPENINTEIIEYISLLNNFDTSSIVNYFDSYFKQKGGIRLNPIELSDMIVFDFPDELIDKINFEKVPIIDKLKALKTNEVFLFNPNNKCISFGILTDKELKISSNLICGGLIYSIWDLKHPIGLNVGNNKYISFDTHIFKQVAQGDTYLITY